MTPDWRKFGAAVVHYGASESSVRGVAEYATCSEPNGMPEVRQNPYVRWPGLREDSAWET